MPWTRKSKTSRLNPASVARNLVPPLKPLECIPVVLKDNFQTANMPTTDASLALKGMQPSKDAFAVARLRENGALILVKTNLHELALAGLTVSSLGGQTKSP